MTNQVELHPYYDQSKLLEFCKSLDITLTGYSPLGSLDSPFASAEKNLLKEPVLEAIAKKHNKTVAQILIGWQVQRGAIVIPKSVTPSRIEENSKVFDFQLSVEDMQEIAKLNQKDGRMIFFAADKIHPHFPIKDDVEF